MSGGSPKQVVDSSALPRATTAPVPLRSLVAEGRAAAEELGRLELPRLTRRLQGAFRETDAGLIADAVEDAMLDCLRYPRKFDGRPRACLEDMLYRAAKQNVLDRLRRERRHQTKASLLGAGSVDDWCNPLAVAPSPAELLEESEALGGRQQTLAQRKQWLENFVQQQPAIDRATLKLMFQGERHWAPYAELLGITHQTEGEQRKAVNDAKHRIHERLKYWIERRQQEFPNRLRGGGIVG